MLLLGGTACVSAVVDGSDPLHSHWTLTLYVFMDSRMSGWNEYVQYLSSLSLSSLFSFMHPLLSLSLSAPLFFYEVVNLPSSSFHFISSSSSSSFSHFFLTLLHLAHQSSAHNGTADPVLAKSPLLLNPEDAELGDETPTLRPNKRMLPWPPLPSRRRRPQTLSSNPLLCLHSHTPL